MLGSNRSQEAFQVAEICQGSPKLGSGHTFGAIRPIPVEIKREFKEEASEGTECDVGLAVGDVEEQRFSESLSLLPVCWDNAGNRGWGRLGLVRHGGLLHALARLRA